MNNFHMPAETEAGGGVCSQECSRPGRGYLTRDDVSSFEIKKESVYPYVAFPTVARIFLLIPTEILVTRLCAVPG